MRPLLVAGALLVAVAAIANRLLGGGAEPLSEFRDFPWTYITEAGMGWDPEAVVIDRGSINGPASVVDPRTGGTAWPAFVHPDLAAMPQAGGRPFIFPLIPSGRGSRSPVIPQLGRPLNQAEIGRATRYFTAEGAQRMERFRKDIER